ncbi:MAG: ABC transporter ATP-binding protein [Lachnospiraceae bacterium]|nr:ABC transporter ATP-binding protein [Lachnospiraceae bacterium]
MVLKAEGISKQFLRASKGTNIFTAIEEMDFTLAEGKLTMINGRSGSGKSTFLNILSGILAPTTGKVMLDDKELYEMKDEELSRLRNISFGFVPQGQSAVRSLTVLENIMLPYTLYGEGEDKTEYAKELMEKMDIIRLENVMPNELSGGEMRRMAIARALIRRPEIVFADEPTGDLDDENTELVLKLFKEMTDNKTTVLLVTHENEAKKYADIMYHMNAGRLEEVSL